MRELHQYQPDALARVRLPCSNKSAVSLADASGSSRQTATLVTLSPRPVVSVAVLLELARWCQQRLAFTEDGDQCVNTQLDSQRPLFVRSATMAKNRGIPNWRQLDPNTQEDLLALLTQIIGHHAPTSRASDERKVPDESH